MLITITFVFLLPYKLFCQYLCKSLSLDPCLLFKKKKKIPSLINKNITQRQTKSKTKRSKTRKSTLLPLLFRITIFQRQHGSVKACAQQQWWDGTAPCLGCLLVQVQGDSAPRQRDPREDFPAAQAPTQHPNACSAHH